MRPLFYIVIFSFLPMLCIAQQQNNTAPKDSSLTAVKYGLHYAVAPDFNLPPKPNPELPFFCALEKKISLTIKSDVKLGVGPCDPIPFLGANNDRIEPHPPYESPAKGR